jgi:hypothetical protein
MRYHHGYGCHGQEDSHSHCGPPPVYGRGPGFEYGWDEREDFPRSNRRRGRFGGVESLQATATRLERYLESLRDEIRAVEQDLRDLAASDDAGARSEDPGRQDHTEGSRPT